LLRSFVEIGQSVGELLAKKNAAYGDSFAKSGAVLAQMFPNGVPVDKFQDMLAITRIIDKLFRVATDKAAFSEDPWMDIAGYAVLAVHSQQK